MKKFIEEPSRKIEIITETDVLVVGSGPGGLSAALAAARTGVKVALVERFGCFGGNITAVGVEGFAWYRHKKTIEAKRYFTYIITLNIRAIPISIPICFIVM